MIGHLRLLCRRAASVGLLALFLTATGGCVVAGVAARALPPPQVEAAYQGMQNQTIAVMTWTDIGVRTDFPSIQLDLAKSLQSKLSTPGIKEFTGATWPVDPRSIVRYQRENPQLDNFSVTQVAPVFKVSRLIYLEITSFHTRSEGTNELFRGGMSGTMKVIEIENGQAKIAYEEGDIRVIFPENSPEEGIPNATDARIYLGTLDAFTTEITHRLAKYEVEE